MSCRVEPPGWDPAAVPPRLSTETARETPVQRTIYLVVANLLMALMPLVAQDSAEQIFRVLPRDAIPAIDAPTFMSASAADRFFSDDEIVIGIVGETEQRAYSTWQLDRHEIVNDVFEGRPIAVTW
jgi:hypothetical protein